MEKHKKYKNVCFKTVFGQSISLNLKRSHGCLSVSIRNEFIFFTCNRALCLGFSVCAIVISMFLLDPLYVLVNIVICLASILFEVLLSVREETVLIVKGLGYQISKRSFIRNTTAFIPHEKVQRIFINEVIFRHRVVFMLSLLIQRKAEHHLLVPVFKDMLPKLDCLEIIYRNMKRFDDS